MGNEVFANGNEIACKSGDAKVIAAFPDVCLSPPSPPAGPVPVPYPDTSFSKDMKNGSKTVKIDGKEVMLKDKSFYKTSPLGNEAATKSLGAGVVSHVITGKTYFVAWSMDVKFEGKNVDRHIDLTTSNHASPMGDTMTTTNNDKAASEEKEEKEKCPCCGECPPHSNQVNPDTNKMHDTIDEMKWYEQICNYYIKRREEMQKILALGNVPEWANNIDKKLKKPVKDIIIEKGNNHEKLCQDLKKKREANPDCDNVHNPPDEKCGKHFKNTKGVGDARKEFTDGVRRESIRLYKLKYPDKTIRNNSDVCHKTPCVAGGCPKSQTNLVPKDALDGDCLEIENIQTAIQSDLPNPKNRLNLF